MRKSLMLNTCSSSNRIGCWLTCGNARDWNPRESPTEDGMGQDDN